MEDWNDKTEGSYPIKIGKYELKKLLGKGSSGVAYLAYDPQSRKDVALKILKSSQSFNSHWEELNKKVRKLCSGLAHPNLPNILDFGIDSSRPYLVTEFIEGQSLDFIIAQKNIPPIPILLKALKELASVLDYCHSLGIIHADLKPSNIILSASSSPYLLETSRSLIKIAASEICETLSDDSVLGTPSYLAPEQIRHRQCNYQTDLFAFALIAFECLTYKLPFVGKSFSDITRSILENHADLNAITANGLPSSLYPIFNRALSKDPRERHESASRFIEEVAQSLIDTQSQLRPIARTEMLEPSKLFNSNIPVSNTESQIDTGLRSTTSKLLTKKLFPKLGRPVPTKIITGFNLRLLLVFIAVPLALFILIIISPRKTLLVLDSDPDLSILDSLNSELSLSDKHYTDTPTEKNQSTDLQPAEVEQSAILIQKIAKSPKTDPGLPLMLEQLLVIDSRSNFLILFEHSSYLVRVAAIKLAIQGKDKSYLPSLRKAFEDQDPLVRGFAVKALGLMGESSDIEFIQNKFHKELQAEVKIAMEKAIKRLSDLNL